MRRIRVGDDLLNRAYYDRGKAFVGMLYFLYFKTGHGEIFCQGIYRNCKMYKFF
jgi:hypothetical protein